MCGGGDAKKVRSSPPPGGYISTNAAMLEQLSRPEWQQQQA